MRSTGLGSMQKLGFGLGDPIRAEVSRIICRVLKNKA